MAHENMESANKKTGPEMCFFQDGVLSKCKNKLFLTLKQEKEMIFA